MIPVIFPINKPNITPNAMGPVKSSKVSLPKVTPALANAKIGITMNATKGAYGAQATARDVSAFLEMFECSQESGIAQG